MDRVKERFAGWLNDAHLTLTEGQWQQFEQYYQLLTEWNERMNLTAITEREQVYTKHFYDSISLSFFFPMNETGCVADIGSGAGFPSLPLKIMFPQLRVTIIDSLNKRVQFLQHVVESLGLPDVACVHGRAEEIGRSKEHRDRYDVVTARAVARLNVLNEFCLPFVRPGGHFIAMKGSQGKEELAEAGKSFQELRGALVSTHEMQLPEEEGQRLLIVVKKTGATPGKYPRKPGTPLKQPIV